MSLSSSQVVDMVASCANNFLESSHMSFHKIHHMNVVSDSSSILSLVVISKHKEFWSLPNSHLLDYGEQIIGISWSISDKSTFMATCWIEITEGEEAAVFIDSCNILHYHFNNHLSFCIDINWRYSRGFIKRLSSCIECCWTGEDEVTTLVLGHKFEHVYWSSHIDFVVEKWFFDWFGNSFFSSKMDDIIDFFIGILLIFENFL